MARNQTSVASSGVFSLLLVSFVVAILYFARDVLIPFTLAILVSFVLVPVVERLERWRFGRVPAVTTAVALLFILVMGIGWLVAGQVVDLANNLPNYKTNIVNKAKLLTSTEEGIISRARQAFDELNRSIADPKHRRAKPAESPQSGANPDAPPTSEAVPVEIVADNASPLGWIKGMVPPVFDALGTAGVVIIFVFFMLIEREDLRNRLIRLIGPSNLNVTTQALDDAAHRVSRYLMMQFIVNASYGFTAAVGLYFIGIPNAVLWGLLAGVLRYIPYIGPWFAAVMPIGLSLAVFDSWTPPILTIALFVAMELVSNNVLEPLLYRSSTGVSTIGILVAAVFWTWLWGAIGLVLATPLTVCLAVLGRYVPQLEFFNVLLSGEPVLAPAAQYYQRLLARDDEEANALAEKQLADSSVAALYDTMLLPALTLAETDAHRGALPAGQQEYIHDSTRELIDELDDRGLFEPAKNESADDKEALASVSARCLACLPARDEADEIAGIMLAQLLQAQGHCAQSLSVKSLASEMLDRVAADKVATVFVSAVPPFATTHARYLIKRLRAKFPDLKIVACVWHPKGGKKFEQRLLAASANKVVTTLREAMEQV